MHWLQTLDTSLFYFVNRTLSNPFFDWLMPILSEQRLFLSARCFCSASGLLWKGGVRVRLCV